MECREEVYSEDYYDLLVNEAYENLIDVENFCMQPLEEYRVIYANRLENAPLSVGTYGYSTLPKCYTILGRRELEASGIETVFNQPSLELFGRGIMIGFVDTGIAYEQNAFRLADGSTRIAALWDQTEKSEKTPQGFFYGREYTRREIDAALMSDAPGEYVAERDEIGHGTLVASIAAGSRDEITLEGGAAPLADLAVVKLKPAKQNLKEYYHIPKDAIAYQENDILAGVIYLENLARSRRQPLILCIALGTNQGDHGGGGALGEYLEQLSTKYQRGVCIAVGNEANKRHHFYGKVQESESLTAELDVTAPNSGFALEFYGMSPDVFGLSIISPTGEVLPNVPIFVNQQQRHLFLLENTNVEISYQSGGIRRRNQLIYVDFSNVSPGIWKIVVIPRLVTAGEFHMYLPMQEFLEKDVFFLSSNPDTTITNPASAELPISTGGYDLETNGIYIDSGRGYSVFEDIVPSFVAPAVNVLGSNVFGQPEALTGTSASVAITAGAAALLMEWNLYYRNSRIVNTVELKRQFINGAKRERGKTYPNREEGYGRLDLYQTFVNLRV